MDLQVLSSAHLEGAEIPAMEEVDDEEVVAELAALKQFWHILLVAGLPVTPQLLTQGVIVSGTLNSVSSLSVIRAISGCIGIKLVKSREKVQILFGWREKEGKCV